MYNKDRFFKILETANVTNGELAKAIHVSSGNISDWKSGKSKPNIDAIVKTAEYLNCTANYLLGMTVDSEELKTARNRTGKLHILYGELPIALIQQKLKIPNYHTFKAWCDGYGDYFNDKIYLLADLFNVSTDYLLGRTEQPNVNGSLDSYEVRLNALLKDTTDQDRNAVSNESPIKLSLEHELFSDPPESQIAAYGSGTTQVDNK